MIARAVLRVLCPDRPGLVADVAALLFRLGANVLHADEHIDAEANSFFQRVEFTLPTADAGERAATARRIGEACDRWGMRWWLGWSDEVRRVALLASKRGHCVFDLLARHRAGELPCEMPLV